MTDLDFNAYIQSAPNDNYVKFFEKISAWKSNQIDSWTTNDMLGYMISSFFTATKKPYAFKYNSTAPSKCYELFLIKKLIARIGSNPKNMKNYIDFVVQNEIGSKKIRTLAVFANEETINNYNYKIMNNEITSKISRTQILPEHLISVFKGKYKINTYGDVSFLYMSDPNNELFKSLNSSDIEDIKRVI